ncbi:MAG TPA: hypothetical protein VHL98_17720 [Microvirga sp.]|jgi:hypothetical protein|nr:hypothetical protein [Microvirga sp.]
MSYAVLEDPSATPDEEHLLMRTGEALALLWRHLPDALRLAILNQAETLSYRQEMAQLRARLGAFLDGYAAQQR